MAFGMFKQLTAEEEGPYRQWARDNYKRLQPILGIWHPAVQEECTRMNAELTAAEREEA